MAILIRHHRGEKDAGQRGLGKAAVLYQPEAGQKQHRLVGVVIMSRWLLAGHPSSSHLEKHVCHLRHVLLGRCGKFARSGKCAQGDLTRRSRALTRKLVEEEDCDTVTTDDAIVAQDEAVHTFVAVTTDTTSSIASVVDVDDEDDIGDDVIIVYNQ